MNKFIVALLVVATVVTLVFSGCVGAPAPPVAPPVAPPAAPENPFAGLAIKPDGTPYYFAYSFVFLTNPWMVFNVGIFENYMKKAGAQYTLHDANLVVEKQIADLEDLILKGPDGVIVHPVDGDACVPVVDKLTQAGISVVVNDIEIPTPSVVALSTADNMQMGRVIGEWLAAYFEEKGITGHVYECQGTLMQTIAHLRHDGFLAGIEGTDITMIGTDCGWADEPCANAILAAFPAHPELNAIFTHGGMLKGASEGLRSLGLLYPVGDPKHILMVSIDANDQTCALVREGWGDAVVDHCPWKEMDGCVKAMFHHVILGNPVPKTIVFPGEVLTYEAIVADWESPVSEIWGNIMLKEVDLDTLPVLERPEISTPTLK